MIRSTRQESRGVGGVGVGVEAGARVAELELKLPGGVLRRVRAGAGVCVIGVPAGLHDRLSEPRTVRAPVDAAVPAAGHNQ